MDIEYLLFLQNLRNATGGIFNSFFAFITNIAVDYYVLVPALILFWCIDKKKGARILLSCGAGMGLNATLKSTFCVYRPWIRDSRVQPLEEVMSGATGYSFPSGHSTSAGSFWSAVAIQFKKHKGLVIFSILMILIVMFSRNFVGVHTPQDVIVGGLSGLLCAFLIAKLGDVLDKHPERDWIVLVGVTVFVIGLLLYISLKSYPMDYVDGELLVDPKKMTVDGFKDPGRFYGIFVGWFLERRLIRFKTEGTKYQKLMRALVGGLLVVFWWTVVATPIGKALDTNWGYFLTQASTPILFMTVYPLIFTRIEAAQAKKALATEKKAE